jgi:hypothetical protein
VPAVLAGEVWWDNWARDFILSLVLLLLVAVAVGAVLVFALT